MTSQRIEGIIMDIIEIGRNKWPRSGSGLLFLLAFLLMTSEELQEVLLLFVPEFVEGSRGKEHPAPEGSGKLLIIKASDGIEACF